MAAISASRPLPTKRFVPIAAIAAFEVGLSPHADQVCLGAMQLSDVDLLGDLDGIVDLDATRACGDSRTCPPAVQRGVGPINASENAGEDARYLAWKALLNADTSPESPFESQVAKRGVLVIRKCQGAVDLDEALVRDVGAEGRAGACEEPVHVLVRDAEDSGDDR